MGGGPKRPKVLLAPMNMAGMPVTLINALRAAGYEAAHIQYTYGRPNPLRYKLDRTVNLGDGGGRIPTQIATVREALNEGFDIFHFWNRSLFYRSDYGGFSGLDLPLIKARGRRIGYRFTGFDLRLPSRDLAVNPHSPFRYEQPALFDEGLVMAYQDYLREYVDRFFVQDPELGQFFPEATIIPRALDLSQWAYVGVERTDRPLVVHAPTNAAAKGTRFVLAAVETLRDEGLKFDFQLLTGLPHDQARQAYRKADIVVDQLLIGATGVLTLEAWALGKPVVVNLRRDLFEPFYETTDLPVINANPDTIVDGLRRAIKDSDLRQDLAKRGRALVEARHDITEVVGQYIQAYDEMHATPPKTPVGDGDFRYFELQLTMAEAAEGFWKRWINGYRRSFDREILRLAKQDVIYKNAWGRRVRALLVSGGALARRDFGHVGRSMLRALGLGRKRG